MKYIKTIICALVIATILCGCSFHFESSVNDLVSPISPLGENADIQSALNSFVSNGYSLRNPSSGNYKTSYNLFDIDGDDIDEAVSFYEPKDNLGEIEMAIIKKGKNGWKVVENIKGTGKSVYSLDFKDVNGDGTTEIVVCWDVINNSTNHEFSVYKISKKDKINLSLLGEQKTVNNYIFFDYDFDGLDELVLFEISTGGYTSSKAEIYSLKYNNFYLLGETKLDSHITTYSNLQTEKAEDDIRIYADAIGSDGASMLTEIVYWSNSYDTIISPFYSYSTGRTKGTSRKAMLPSMDINDDGRLEIPLDGKKKLPKQIKSIDWKIYKNTILIHTDYSLYVENDNYFVIISDDDYSNVSAKYDTDNRELSVINKKTKKNIFMIKPVLKAVYDEKNYTDYSIVMENSGYYYLAKLGDDTSIKISIDELKGLIKSC